MRSQVSARAFAGVSAAALTIALATAAAAQGAPTSPQSPAADDGAPVVEEVVITGTSIRGIEPTGAQTVQLGREQISATGLTTVQEITKTLPQLQGLGFGEAPVSGQNGGGNVQRGTTLNLRGLGSSATLLLVDGHRLAPTGTVVNFTEANVVPVAALERIEVVADGASAIYGSDAVAGVVNYVLRRNFSGVEISGRYTDSKYWNQYGANIVAGRTWDQMGSMGKGNVLASYDYDYHSPFVRGDSAYLRQDVSSFGGADSRLLGNSITSNRANITVQGPARNSVAPAAGNFTLYTVPAGSTGAGLTAAGLLVNQPSLADTSDYSDYLADSKRHQFVILANQELTPWLDFGLQAFYTRRKSDTRSVVLGTGGNQLVVPATSPFYIAGIPGVAPGAPLNVQYNFYKDIGYAVQKNTNTSLTVTGELSAKLGHDWQGDISYTYGRDTACGACTPGKNVNIDAVQSLIASGVFNPFDTRPLPDAVVARFTGDNVQRTRNTLGDVVVKFDGPLFSVPGGQVRAAVGGEFIRNSQWLQNGANRGAANIFAIDVTSSKSRHIEAAFGELFVPVVGDEMDVPLVQSFTLDAAVRTENYSDFGRTTNPKLGVQWEVNNSVKFRGAWGTSFRAPSLADVNPNVFTIRLPIPVANNSGDPTIPIDIPGANLTNVLVYGGSNPDLQPETAETYTFGVDFTPEAFAGFKASATYFNIEYQDQIIGLFSQNGQFLASPQNRANFAPYIFATPTPGACVNGVVSTYNPIVARYLALPALFGLSPTNPCGIHAVLDARNQNAGSTVQDGFDFQASYDFDRAGGHWSVGGSFTYLNSVKVKLTDASPEVERVNTINYPIRLRGRATLAWSSGPYAANLFINHTGGYTNNLPIALNGIQQPTAHVKSWTTADFGLAYNAGLDAGWASGLRVSLNIQNILDRDPPIVISTNLLAIDNQNSNPNGRVVTVQLAKRF